MFLVGVGKNKTGQSKKKKKIKWTDERLKTTLFMLGKLSHLSNNRPSCWESYMNYYSAAERFCVMEWDNLKKMLKEIYS